MINKSQPFVSTRRIVCSNRILECSLVLLLALSLLFVGCDSAPSDQAVAPSGTADYDFVLQQGDIKFVLNYRSFRYGFTKNDGTIIVAPHKESGLVAGTSSSELQNAISTSLITFDTGSAVFDVVTSSDDTVRVTVTLIGGVARFRLDSSEPRAMALRTSSASPGYGLADHWIHAQSDGGGDQMNRVLQTEVVNYENDQYTSSDGYFTRLVSNFLIFPTHNFAMINIDPLEKIVRSTDSEILQGSAVTKSIPDLYYFFGTPAEIYRSFLKVRNDSGFPVMKPKPAFYGVGWEAWGALAWKTSQATVLEDVDTYLELGYPLSWMVIGSGFWPKEDETMHATTSFGLWDPELYPDPVAFKEHFREQGLKIFLGLRITFLVGGPYSAEGITNDFFIKEDGRPKVYEFEDFPRSPTYLLDTQKEEAVRWYVDLAKTWGVDGFKEDLYSYYEYELRDDKVNAVNEALMSEGYYVMMRNSYLASTGELHRIDDFNYDQVQDRGPLNSLIYAYSGFPLTYMDIVGGKFGGTDFDGEVSPRIRMYMMRNAVAAALHPSMSMGKGPWHFKDERVSDTVLAAAKLHDRLLPYFFSQAYRFYTDGYPWTMTPLPIAYPDDPDVHGRENNSVRGYQWMIGDALLAYPLYGDDYESQSTRDVYLPRGHWIDYDTGEVHEGPKLLHNFEIPVDKTPLFVGGSGVVLEKIDGENRIRIYPVTHNVETVLYFSDDSMTSRIRIDTPEWSSPTIFDVTADAAVKSEFRRHAFEFEAIEGHDYVVR